MLATDLLVETQRAASLRIDPVRSPDKCVMISSRTYEAPPQPRAIGFRRRYAERSRRRSGLRSCENPGTAVTEPRLENYSSRPRADSLERQQPGNRRGCVRF